MKIRRIRSIAATSVVGILFSLLLAACTNQHRSQNDPVAGDDPVDATPRLAGGPSSDGPATRGARLREANLIDTLRAKADSLDLSSGLRDLYTAEEPRPLWVDGEGPLPRSRAAVSALRSLEEEAIDPTRVRTGSVLDRWRELDARPDSRTPDLHDLALFELELSRAVLDLGDVLLRGTDLREELDVEWRIERDEAPGPELLERIRDRGVEPVLDSLRPTLPVYDETVRALARYRDRMPQGWGVRIEGDAIAEAGDSLPVVAEVRTRLSAGMNERERELAGRGSLRPAVMDSALARAVALFQERHGLQIDSVIGPETIDELNTGIDQRVHELEVNLDRLRRLPRDPGDRSVLVNVAGFELRALDEGEPTLAMAVIVGQPEWRTVVFDEEMDHLIFNPYWHVPESIERAETLPKARRDPDYLASQDLVVVPSDDNFGEPVPRDRFDWSEVDADTWNYDFRQQPGEKNALGKVKFMFPNRHSIYLHDTPADELFEKDMRAFSHGCIRVERPGDLARWVMRHASDRDPAVVDSLFGTEDRTRVELEDPIPVHIVYLTTWVEPDGRVFFHPDIYDRDPSLAEAGSAGPSGASS